VHVHRVYKADKWDQDIMRDGFEEGRTDASISAMRSWKASGRSSSSTARRWEQYVRNTWDRNAGCCCMKLHRFSRAASSAADSGGPCALTTRPSTACLASLSVQKAVVHVCSDFFSIYLFFSSLLSRGTDNFDCNEEEPTAFYPPAMLYSCLDGCPACL
jgi:hypothetical protein